jgi:putative endonuclease
MIFYVYILYSEFFQRYYIGQTNNLKIRLKRHNSGSEKATRPYRPWELIWYCEKPDRSSAMELELKLKNLNRARLIQFIKKYSGNNDKGRDENG